MKSGTLNSRTIATYSAVKQESVLTRNTISLLIHYARLQIADALPLGIDVQKKMFWQCAVASLSKNPADIEGIPCARCMQTIPLFAHYYRKRSNHTTKTYHIECAQRLGLRRR